MKLGKHAWGIWGIALVVALAFAFLLPFTHNAVYFIALFFTLLAFVLCAWSFWRSFALKDELFSKYMGWPIFKVGLTALAAQFVLGFGLMMLAFLCPVYIALLLEIGLFATVSVGLIAREAARQMVEQSEQSLSDKTAVWKEVRRKVATLEVPQNAEWDKLLEDIRYADPTDNEQSLPYTRKILELLDGPVDADTLFAIQKQMRHRKQFG